MDENSLVVWCSIVRFQNAFTVNHDIVSPLLSERSLLRLGEFFRYLQRECTDISGRLKGFAEVEASDDS